MGVEIFLFILLLIGAVIAGLVVTGSWSAIFLSREERRRKDRLEV